MVGFHCCVLPKLTARDLHTRCAMLDLRHGTAEVNTPSEALGECVRHQLITAPNPQQLGRDERRTAQLLDRGGPDPAERRTSTAKMGQCGAGSLLALEQIGYGHVVQFVQSRAEWLGLLLDGI